MTRLLGWLKGAATVAAWCAMVAALLLTIASGRY